MSRDIPHPNRCGFATPAAPPEREGLALFAEATTGLAALAAQLLGWRPGEFWAATPAELSLSLGAPEAGGEPPSRSEILAMMERESDG